MISVAERNRRLVLAERPTGMVDDSTVRVEEEDVPEPGAGEALARVRYLSIDPTIRTWMNDAPGYLPPIADRRGRPQRRHRRGGAAATATATPGAICCSG